MNYKYKCGNRILKFNKINIKKFKKNKEVSVILPTYNEEECVERIINSIEKILKNKNYEIIIADDNSTDRTPEIIDNYNSDKIVALHRYHNRGIIYAILDGVKVARSDIIVMMDADFSHPPAKILEMLRYIKSYDIVSCSRFRKGGGMVAPFVQKYTTIVFNYVIRLIFFDTNLSDFTSGFHVIRKDKFLGLKLKYKSIWGEFDIELLYTAKKKNYKIKEIPYVYTYREEGKTKNFFILQKNYLKYAYIYCKMAIKVRFFK